MCKLCSHVMLYKQRFCHTMIPQHHTPKTKTEWHGQRTSTCIAGRWCNHARCPPTTCGVNVEMFVTANFNFLCVCVLNVSKDVPMFQCSLTFLNRYIYPWLLGVHSLTTVKHRWTREVTVHSIQETTSKSTRPSSGPFLRLQLTLSKFWNSAWVQRAEAAVKDQHPCVGQQVKALKWAEEQKFYNKFTAISFFLLFFSFLTQ